MKTTLLTIVISLIASINLLAQSQLIFTYDTAGNQIERKFVTPSSKQLVVESDLEASASISDISEREIKDLVKVYPNPTKGKLKLEWSPLLSKSIKEITASQLSGKTWKIPLQNTQQNFVEIDLTHDASGVYIVRFELQNDKEIIKKIIKK